MDSFAQWGCNLWHRFKLTIGFLLGVIVSWIWKYINWIFSYQDIDLIIKAVSGIGAIVAGIFVYVKWQDEKTRGLYEKRLQEVYAPLCGLLIKQETYRWMKKDIAPELNNRSEVPILTATQTRHTISISGGKLKTELEKLKPEELPNEESFLDLMSKINYGLARPSLLETMEITKMLHYLKENDSTDIKNVMKERVEIQKRLISEIVDGYNECIEKLGIDNQKVNLDNPPIFWEKS